MIRIGLKSWSVRPCPDNSRVSTHKMSSKSMHCMHAFWSNLTNRQIDRQTSREIAFTISIVGGKKIKIVNNNWSLQFTKLIRIMIVKLWRNEIISQLIITVTLSQIIRTTETPINQTITDQSHWQSFTITYIHNIFSIHKTTVRWQGSDGVRIWMLSKSDNFPTSESIGHTKIIFGQILIWLWIE